MSGAWSSSGTTVPHNVRLGMWTNWSRGPVFGATLTLNRESRKSLDRLHSLFRGLSCLALLEGRVPSLPSMLLDSGALRDALHHQRQADSAQFSKRRERILVHRPAVVRHGVARQGSLCFACCRPFLPSAVLPVRLRLADVFSSQYPPASGTKSCLTVPTCGPLYTAGHGAVDHAGG